MDPHGLSGENRQSNVASKAVYRALARIAKLLLASFSGAVNAPPEPDAVAQSPPTKVHCSSSDFAARRTRLGAIGGAV